MLDIQALIRVFVERDASDLYLTGGAPPCLRLESGLARLDAPPLVESDIRQAMLALVGEVGVAEFDAAMEFNAAFDWNGETRLRVNMFRQRQHSAVVIRRIRYTVPQLESLGLTAIHAGLIMEKRGLIVIAGSTGCGKSTTLASMVQHRNRHGSGHILTIEDPIEFIHAHENCIVSQREVGLDTASFSAGLKNALRQMPDVIVIGEIRDQEAMEQALAFAETGHLCLTTLHARSAAQAIERIVNLFPEEQYKQVLLSLASNLKAILSQRLVDNARGKKSLALEIMLNRGLITDLIREGRIKEMKEVIEKGGGEGMRTFEQSLFELCAAGIISEETAMAEADSPANLRLAIQQAGGGQKRKQGQAPSELQQKIAWLSRKEF